MIFTVGQTENYLRYFAEQGTPQKAIGGSVWQTQKEAKKYAPDSSGYSVFGVMADWDTQTKPNPEGDWHDLLVDADLVILDDRQ